MAVLNYAGRTIREETMYNKELMGRDRGSVPGASEEEGGCGWMEDGSRDISVSGSDLRMLTQI